MVCRVCRKSRFIFMCSPVVRVRFCVNCSILTSILRRGLGRSLCEWWDGGGVVTIARCRWVGGCVDGLCMSFVLLLLILSAKSNIWLARSDSSAVVCLIIAKSSGYTRRSGLTACSQKPHTRSGGACVYLCTSIFQWAGLGRGAARLAGMFLTRSVNPTSCPLTHVSSECRAIREVTGRSSHEQIR
jgi:hypothetical protein